MKTFAEFKALDKWRSTGLLNGLTEQTQLGCANALDAQLVINETDDTTKPQWKRVSIPVLRRIFGTVDGLQGGETLNSEWKNTKIKAPAHFITDEKGPVRDEYLQFEADQTAELARIIADFIKAKKIDRISGVNLAQNGDVMLRIG
jgi:hypothetical protein